MKTFDYESPALSAVPPFSLADVEARGRARLTLELPEDTFTRALPRKGDHNLNRDRFDYEGLGKPAAVLIPVVPRADGATLLFTQRTSKLRSHAGQVAFPGGRMDPEDSSPVDAALREAFEEIGLAREQATPLGYLDPYQTGTGYRVVPVVAIVDPAMELTLNPDEVDDVFETPLDFLMDPRNRSLQHREINGVLRSFHAITWRERFIWGVTAGILQNFHDRLYT